MRLASMKGAMALLIVPASVAGCAGSGGAQARQPEPSPPPPASPAVNPFQAQVQPRSYPVTLTWAQQNAAQRRTATAVITIRPARDQVCWSITQLAGVPDPLFAYIHRGPPGAAGPVVVPLGTRYAASGCTAGVAPALLAQLESAPGGYYLAIHTSSQPSGAVRGQL